MDDLIVGDLTIPNDQLEETFLTSGGPGGQHANRNETAVRLRFTVSGSSLPEDIKKQLTAGVGDVIEVTASDSRSQFRNRAIARQRLREAVEAALLEQKTRKQTKPTRASKRRRLANKRARGEKKRLRRRPRLDD